MRGRKRRHDDVHWPMAGKGKRAPRSRVVQAATLTPTLYCSDCPPPNYPTDKTRCDACPRRYPRTESKES